MGECGVSPLRVFYFHIGKSLRGFALKLKPHEHSNQWQMYSIPKWSGAAEIYGFCVCVCMASVDPVYGITLQNSHSSSNNEVRQWVDPIGVHMAHSHMSVAVRAEHALTSASDLMANTYFLIKYISSMATCIALFNFICVSVCHLSLRHDTRHMHSHWNQKAHRNKARACVCVLCDARDFNVIDTDFFPFSSYSYVFHFFSW